MKNQWWYSNADQKVGPLTLEALQQKLMDLQVSEFTLVWRKGFESWLPLGDVEEFKHALDGISASPPPLPQASKFEFPAKLWKRFLAKYIDLSAFGLILGSLFGYLVSVSTSYDDPLVVWLQKSGAELLLGLVFMPVIVLLEACCLAWFGNTPGTILLGIQIKRVVSSACQESPVFLQLLKRQIGVYWFGLGAGLPLISLITMLFQRSRLKQTGSTRYDEARFTVTERQIGFTQLALAALVTMALFCTTVFLQVVAMSFLKKQVETGQAISNKPTYSILDDPFLGKASLARDFKTGLVWQRCSVGQAWSGSNCTGEAARFKSWEIEQLARDGWRLPSVRELHSLVWCSSGQTQVIVDPLDGGEPLKNWCGGKYQSPAIRQDAFPGISSEHYWTAPNDLFGLPLGIYFLNGYIIETFPSFSLRVQLVR